MERSLTIDDTTPRRARGIGAEELGALFDRHHRRLHGLACRLCRNGDEAYDLVQDAFVRAARNLDRVPCDEDHAEKWLVRVLVNLCRDRGRRQEVRRRFADEVAAPETTADAGDAVIARTTVRSALAELPARQRAVVVLHELEGMPTPRIGELLGIHRVTVRWHLAAARRRLASLLGAEDEG